MHTVLQVVLSGLLSMQIVGAQKPATRVDEALRSEASKLDCKLIASLPWGKEGTPALRRVRSIPLLRRIELSASGSYVAVQMDNVVHTYDVKNGVWRSCEYAPSERVDLIRAYDAGEFLASVSGIVRREGSDTDHGVFSEAKLPVWSSVECSPKGDRLIVSSVDGDRQLQCFLVKRDAPTERVALQRPDRLASVRVVDWSSDGDFAVAWGSLAIEESGTRVEPAGVSLYSLDGKRRRHWAPGDSPVRSLSFSFEEDKLFWVDDQLHSVLVRRGEICHQDLHLVAWHDLSPLLSIGVSEAEMSLWSSRSWTPLRSLLLFQDDDETDKVLKSSLSDNRGIVVVATARRICILSLDVP